MNDSGRSLVERQTGLTDIVMPKLGLTMTEGTLSEWKVRPGDRVLEGDVLFAVETEKIVNDVEADTEGEIVELLVEQGATVPVGSAIARLRMESREHKDAAPTVEQEPPAAERAVRRELTSVEAVTARRLSEAKREIPHFYVTSEADVRDLAALRDELNSRRDGSAKITVTHMIIMALARALTSLPELNRVWDAGSILFHKEVDIGIAVETPRGLMVPVVRNVERLTLSQIADQVSALATRARNGTLTAEDVGGGVVSVSNVGMFGATSLLPIINPGQSAILGVGTIKPVFRPDEAGRPSLHSELILSLSCDHRVWDGAMGARLLGRIIELLEGSMRVLVESEV